MNRFIVEMGADGCVIVIKANRIDKGPKQMPTFRATGDFLSIGKQVSPEDKVRSLLDYIKFPARYVREESGPFDICDCGVEYFSEDKEDWELDKGVPNREHDHNADNEKTSGQKMLDFWANLGEAE